MIPRQKILMSFSNSCREQSDKREVSWFAFLNSFVTTRRLYIDDHIEDNCWHR